MKTAQNPDKKPKGSLVTFKLSQELVERAHPFWQIRIECRNEKSNKFWEISGGGPSDWYVITRWGKIGSEGTYTIIPLKKAYQRLRNRLNRGYEYAEGTIGN